jgi:hypothetical protein
MPGKSRNAVADVAIGQPPAAATLTSVHEDGELDVGPSSTQLRQIEGEEPHVVSIAQVRDALGGRGDVPGAP